jgi:hypothetical protein
MKLSSSLILMLALVLLATTVVAQTNAVNGCSLASLKGTYGVLEQGTIPPYPVVLAANATYDGAGKESGTFNASIGGLPVAGTFTGTYAVNSDCTYTEEFVATPPGVSLHVSGVITGNGIFREIHYIYTDSDRIVSGTAKKTPPGGCSLRTLSGAYAVLGQGTIVAQPPLLVAHVGPFNADGAGHFSGSEYVTLGGIALQDTFTGDDTVNSDCSASVIVTDSNGLVTHEWGVITGEGRSQELNSIVTEPGWIFVESVKRQ